jgi:SPP1 gp7 family putative phage head morphogenesis protein
MVEYDLDIFLRHQLYIERLASGGANKLMDDMEVVYNDIRKMLNGYDSIANRTQLNEIMAAIESIVTNSGGWDNLTDNDLLEMASYEAKWQASYQQSMTGLDIEVPSEAKLVATINNSMMNLNSGSRSYTGPWKNFIDNNLDNHAQAVNSSVQRGFMRGDPMSLIQKAVKQVSEGIVSRDAMALARTGYIHYAAQANEAMIDENKDILDQYYYIVTFDSRTSDVCIGVSKFNEKGMRFKVGDLKAPVPPLHYQCRTRRMAVPEGFVMIGTKAAVGGQEGEDAAKAFAKKDRARRVASQVRYKGRKDNNIFKAGQVDASLSYESWLKSQPRWFIDDTLGPARARLMINGGVPLANFSDMTGRPLTLIEILQRDNQNRAGRGI